MSNVHLVKCPHVGCDWFGILPISHNCDYGGGPAANVSMAVFECPQCRQEWQGCTTDDAFDALPLENQDEDLELSDLRFEELGVGD
jgi:hypothetical protein